MDEKELLARLDAQPGEVVKTETKMSVTESAGYKCQNCGIVNVVYNYAAPEKCLNCGSNLLKICFKNILINKTTAKTIQL